jgi:serine/threonine protein kinase
MPLVESGQVLGPWTLQERIGEGGNGEVWRAKAVDGRSAAIKVLRDARPNHVPFKRFAREVETVQSLGEMPGVVPIFERHVPEEPSRKERVWYAMPMAEQLTKHLHERPVDEVVSAVRDLAKVLEDLATNHGLAHRDLKPDNLFWLDGPALSDFGLVHIPDATTLTDPGRVPGSFGYIADEVMQQVPDIDWALADVFSLAKVLWVLLVSSSSFPPQGSLEADGGPSTLSRALTIPGAEELDRILAAATRDHSERIAMGAFAGELDAWLSTVPRPRNNSLEGAIRAARESMETTFSNRDGVRRRQKEAEGSVNKLQTEAADIESALVSIDSSCLVGPGAIGRFNQWIEQGEYMGGPSIEATHHHGFRISREAHGLDLVLVAAFCLQVDEEGVAYLGGILVSGFEEVSGGHQCLLEQREAPVGSIQLDRYIEEMVQEAQDQLPSVMEHFSRGL